MPLFIIYLSFQSFALQGLVLYWIISNLYSIFQQYTVNGWGQLPILGSGGGGAAGGGNGKDPGNGPNKGKPRSGSTKVLVGQTELSGRRNRRR
jgi:hypothetical protein